MTAPVAMPVLRFAWVTVAATFSGLTFTVTTWGTAWPLPSSTVTVKVSTLSAVLAPVRAAACRVVKVGV